MNYNQVSQQHIDALFHNQHFITKLQQTYIQLSSTEHLLTHPSIPKNHHQSKSLLKDVLQNSNQQKIYQQEYNKNNIHLHIDHVVQDICQLVLDNFKQCVFKQNNNIYDGKFNAISIMEDIQNIKQYISKIGQTASFIAVSAKNHATQQSVTTAKQYPQSHLKKPTQNTQQQLSLYQNNQHSLSIQLNPKTSIDDKLNNFSFMSSFINDKDNKINQDIINQKINTSINKIKIIIDDKIAQIQQEFTNRVQKIMKTIKNLIMMFNQSEINSNSNSEIQHKNYTKNNKINNSYQYMQSNTKKYKNNLHTITSKSSVLNNHHYKISNQEIQIPQYQKYKIDNYNNHNNNNNNNNNNNRKKNQGILHHGYKKLSALFGGNGNYGVSV